ncbi:zinc finger MYM-type protein 1-like [Metopolophium dirhodum]|uniref:zinc finger MYM-type protein 1-like n=2 Tax=Metopolophium dirhodum TaxID=44670 RepID=UPI00298FBDFB|nr:zinc finger MYM-type protein 1-like [Metopolophium dirhodum]
MSDHVQDVNFITCECGKQENNMSSYNWLLHIASCVVRKSKLTNKNISNYFSKTPTINKNVGSNEISVAVAPISESTTSSQNTDIGLKRGNLVSINQGLPLFFNTPKTFTSYQPNDTKLSSVSNNESPPTTQFSPQQDNLSNFHCLSNDIQNDLINSIKNVIITKIKNEIKDADFLAVITDETTDITKRSQLTTVFRYVNDKGVQERFIGFSDVSADRSAKSLADHFFSILPEYICDENKLVAQTYDGAAVMSGSHNGLQTLIKQKYKNAMYIHCYAHKLDLVLKQSVSHIKECKIFFTNLNGFAVFFSNSTKRINELDLIVKKRFPTIAPTRWNYNSRLINIMVEHKKEINQLMQSIVENADKWDGESIICARGFCLTLEDFDFNFNLIIFGKILPLARYLFDVLQKKVFDISYCTQKINEFKKQLNEYRQKFNLVWNEVNDLEKNKIIPSRNKRCRMVQVSEDRKINYKRLFYEIIDTILVKIDERFSEVYNLKFMGLLDFEKFSHYKDNFPQDKFSSLKQTYGQYFEFPKLKSELSIIYSSDQFHQTHIYKLLEYLRETDLTTVLPQVTKLCALILTIPATSASAERSFSALKRIKTYLRNNQTQNRLSNLSLLSIEKEVLMTTKCEPNFHNDVIKDFIKQNRRIELSYK